MTELIKKTELLCNIDGTSGDENSVADFIISEIKGYCGFKKDNLGNIIVFKKGKSTPNRKIMLDAHMDEVGLIITDITPDGFLKFKTVGGIETSALMFRRVKIEGKIDGVICGTPIHLLSSENRKKLPSDESLYIDIGASGEEAKRLVLPGDRAVICGEFIKNGEKILSKAIDDRIGCAILIELIKTYDEYDFYASFSVQEEVGLRGAKTAAFGINPDCAIVLEGTTAADTDANAFDKQVCNLDCGPVVSFMDRATVYDKKFYTAALKSGIPCQPKRAVAGGNNSGAIHLSREGVRTVAVSVPCRYIHSCSSVAEISDCENAFLLAKYLLSGIASGTIE